MAKYTRIYTRTGDDGTTGLVGGQRIKKNALRLEAYGTVDELSSAIGVVRAGLRQWNHAEAHAELAALSRRLDAWLAWVQDVLFNLGTELATLPKDRWADMPLVSAEDTKALERAIDEAQHDLPALDTFILPGGSYPGAFLHLSRTVCRRAERGLITLRETEDDVSIETVHYLNRLSDALFVWSRWVNAARGEPESQWNSKTTPPTS
jgi:cob(I)alamin adenosyltransferase